MISEKAARKKRATISDTITLKTKNDTTFTYTKLKLITLVKKYPVIWQKNHPLFHSRLPRSYTWRKIATELDNNFTTITEEEMDEIVKALNRSWYYTRNRFIKLSKINGNMGLMKYAKDLEYLLSSPNENEVIEIEDTIKIEADSKLIHKEFQSESSLSTNEEFNANYVKASKQAFPGDDVDNAGVRLIRNCSAENLSLLKTDESNANMEANQNAKRQRTSSPTHVTAIENHLKHNLVPEQPPPQLPQHSEAMSTISTSQNRPLWEACDADQAFFDSIKPMICNWRTHKKMNFQIEVRKMIKDIDKELI